MSGNKFWKFCSQVLARWLAAILLTMLTAMPVASTIQKITVPDNISDVLGEIDFTKLIENNVDFQAQLEDVGIPPEAINDVMHSEVVGDIVELYAEDIGKVLEGSEEETSFSSEAVMGILNDNIDEIAQFTREYVPGANQIGDKEFKAQLQETMQTQSVAVMELLPSVSDLKQSAEGSGVKYGDLSFLKNGIVFVRETLMPIFCVAVCGLSILIIILQYRALRGFWRTGITFASAGATTMVLAISVGGILKLTESSIPVEIINLLKPLVQVLSRGFYAFAITYLVVAAACLAIFGIAVLVRKKRGVAAKATDAPEESIEQTGKLALETPTEQDC